MMRTVFAAVAFTAASLTTTVMAQSGGPGGQWRCRHANQSVTNNRFENWIYEFGLAVAPDGSRFQAQGSYTAATAGFSVPFIAEGQWQQTNQGAMAQGSERRQDGTNQRFTLVFTSFGPGVMSNRFQSPQGILLTDCRQ